MIAGSGGFKFTRQQPIGPYVVDFVCRDKQLIVEVDGGQHADSVSDQLRDAQLTSLGYRVIRFWNNDVLANTEGVLERLRAELETAPHPVPLPVNGERERSRDASRVGRTARD